MGVAAETLALNDFGLVQCFGELTNVKYQMDLTKAIFFIMNSAVTGGLTESIVIPTSGIIVEDHAAVAQEISRWRGQLFISVLVKLTALPLLQAFLYHEPAQG